MSGVFFQAAICAIRAGNPIVDEGAHVKRPKIFVTAARTEEAAKQRPGDKASGEPNQPVEAEWPVAVDQYRDPEQRERREDSDEPDILQHAEPAPLLLVSLHGSAG